MIRRFWFYLISMFLIISLFACSDSGREDRKTIINQDEENNVFNENVVTIEGETFDQDDLAFYTLMRNIQIEINRHFDEKQYEGEELKDRHEFWDEQIAYYENINVQLQSLIELYAMALLAKEKNYFNPKEKIEKEVNDFLTGIKEIERAKNLISEFGEEEFNRRIQEYMDYSLLRDRVVDDLIEDLQEENPDLSEEELNYELSHAYEDLFQAQVNDLEIEVHLN